MRHSTSTPWLNRFAWFTAAATLLLICSGGMVTSKGVGLAVPDWPTTFGYNTFLFPASKWIGGIFFEHTHRLIASTVGLLTLILAIWLWTRETAGSTRWLAVALMLCGTAILGIRTRPLQLVIAGLAGAAVIVAFTLWCRDRQGLRWIGVAALGAVILQGVLGGLRVTMLKDEIGIFHACLAQAFLGLLVVIALATSPGWGLLSSAARPEVLKRTGAIAVATALAVYLQLALGATMRHQHRDLSILDFPTANGAWIPDTSPEAIARINGWRDTRGLSDVTPFQIWLQMAHRFGAVAVAIATIAIWSAVRKPQVDVPLLRRLTNLLAALVICQISLGAWTIWSNKAADVATAHVAFGAAIFATAVALCAVCYAPTSRSPAPFLSETAARQKVPVTG